MSADNPGTGRTGMTMIILGSLCVLGILTLAFNKFLARQTNPNSEISSQISNTETIVTLIQNRAGHYVASASINGVPVEVLVDTGASMVSIPARISRQAGLTAGPAFAATTANGTIMVNATVIENIRLGEIELHNVRASINPHMDDDFVLLGMSFLKELEFTQRQNTLILRQYQD